MRYLLPGTLALTLLLAVAPTSHAEMPEELVGTWKLNAAATEAAMRSSPEWDEEAEKRLPMILKHMSKVRYIFADGTITAKQGDKQQEIHVTVESHEDNTTVFKADAGDRTVTFTARLNADGNLNLRSSEHDDLDYYWWEKAE